MLRTRFVWRHVLGASALLGSVLLSAPAVAASIDGRYVAVIDGVQSVIELRAEGSKLSGSLQENGATVQLSGELRGQTAQLQMMLPGSQQVLGTVSGPLRDGVFDATARVVNPQTGQSQQRQGRFTRQGDSSAAAKGGNGKTAAAEGTLDPRIIGTWVHDEVINSTGGVGAASFATRRTMVLGADGRVEQWVESAGGGGNWSYGGGRTTEFSGQWSTRNGMLLLRQQGQANFEPATAYRLADRYLVLEGKGKKIILQRR